MSEIILKGGAISAVSYVQCTRDYECECGTKSVITLQLPEGVEYNGEIMINASCPMCQVPVIIPTGYHYIENYILLTK